MNFNVKSIVVGLGLIVFSTANAAASATTELKFNCDDSIYDLSISRPNPDAIEMVVKTTDCSTLPETDSGFCVRLAGVNYTTWSLSSDANDAPVYILSGHEFTDEWTESDSTVLLASSLVVQTEGSTPEFRYVRSELNLSTGKVTSQVTPLNCKIL